LLGGWLKNRYKPLAFTFVKSAMADKVEHVEKTFFKASPGFLERAMIEELKMSVLPLF
jgi:hypothetical protein